jgi:hypothetical protein
MTESAAYPAFMWSMLGMQRALAAPGLRRDVIALLSIGLAVSARTQFIVLLPVFLVAIFAERANHSMVLARIGRASVEDAFKTGLRVAAREHRQLLLIGGAIAVLAGVLVLVTSPNSVVGLYGTVFEKTVFPRGLGKHMLEHLATIMVGFGILPVVLAGAFVASALRSPVARTRHSFAWLVLLSTAAVLFVSSSFNINFSIGQLNDRYMFYVLPLIAVAAVVALVDRDVSWQSIAITGALAALVVRLGHFGGYNGAFWVGAPASAIDPVLNGKLWQFNQLLPGALGIKMFLAIVVLAGSGLAALVASAWRGPAAVAAVSLPVVLFLAIETQYQYDSQTPWQRPTPNVVKNSLRTAGIGNVDWVDKALPSGSVALVPSVTVTQVAWWQDEFWDRRVDKLFRVVNPDEPPQYARSLVHLQLKTLFHDQVRIDSSDGTVTGLPRSRMTPYVVVADADSRFGFAGARTLAHDPGSHISRLLQQVDVPYRLAWRVRGLLDDDWIIQRDTRMLLYPRSSRSERWRVRLTLAAPIDVKHTRPWVITAPGVRHSGRVKPLGHKTIRFSLCVRGGAPATVGLRMKGHDLLPDGRKIRLLLSKVSAAPTGARCRA